MNLGIDLDDCILDTTPKIMEMLYEKFGYGPYSGDRCDNYKISEAFDVPEDIAEKAVQLAISSPDIEALPNVGNSINYLYYIGNNIYIISHRDKSLYDVSIGQIRKAGVTIPYKLILSKESHMPTKSKYINRYNIDLFIEDRADTIESIHTDCKCRILIMDRPWNKLIKEDNKRLFRVYNWSDILDYFYKGR